MGGLILLEAVGQGRRWFDGAVVTAPMLPFAGMRGAATLPNGAKVGARIGLGRMYVPGGGPIPVVHGPFLGNRATSDPVRYERASSIVQHAPELALGSPTIAWANAAFEVMDRIED